MACIVTEVCVSDSVLAINVSDVYVGSEEDNENGQNLGGQNLGGEDLGGVNENAQNFVEKNVDQNVTAINVDDDNLTPNAFEPTNSKSDKPHGNTTSAPKRSKTLYIV
ncbi:hypothetical protein ACLOJK_028944 [Asimina triloba]